MLHNESVTKLSDFHESLPLLLNAFTTANFIPILIFICVVFEFLSVKGFLQSIITFLCYILKERNVILCNDIICDVCKMI